ncbi:M15 family peptidase [bacterium]|nr:MAG: M15 family peptidase [bacterium]
MAKTGILASVAAFGILGLLLVYFGRRYFEAPAPLPPRRVVPSPPIKAKAKPKARPKANPAPPSLRIASRETRKRALGENDFPETVLKSMAVVPVRYVDFQGRLSEGQIVVHRDLAEEVRAIFDEILAAESPIEKVVPIVAYGWDDEASIADNNSSGFNYRKKIGPGAGESLSVHAYGRAIDINPRQNPYLGKGELKGYAPDQKGTITRDSPIYRAFRKRGWRWGGDWKVTKDYQHFEKRRT